LKKPGEQRGKGSVNNSDYMSAKVDNNSSVAADSMSTLQA